ncbi:hypothetical protein LSAT2_010218 [Lamellibrachia satsuma]|nr:hypothetical protein LSAT2_010218 [Lamellibrachia satsuma]
MTFALCDLCRFLVKEDGWLGRLHKNSSKVTCFERGQSLRMNADCESINHRHRPTVSTGGLRVRRQLGYSLQAGNTATSYRKHCDVKLETL